MFTARDRKRLVYACAMIGFALAVLALLTPSATAQVGGAGGQVGGAGGGQVGGAGGQVGGAGGGQVGGAGGGQVGGAGGGQVGGAGGGDQDRPVVAARKRVITLRDLATPRERAAAREALSSDRPAKD